MLMREKAIVLQRPVKLQTGLLSYLSASPALPSPARERQAGVTYSQGRTPYRSLSFREEKSLHSPTHGIRCLHHTPDLKDQYTSWVSFLMSYVARRDYKIIWGKDHYFFAKEYRYDAGQQGSASYLEMQASSLVPMGPRLQERGSPWSGLPSPLPRSQGGSLASPWAASISFIESGLLLLLEVPEKRTIPRDYPNRLDETLNTFCTASMASGKRENPDPGQLRSE